VQAINSGYSGSTIEDNTSTTPKKLMRLPILSLKEMIKGFEVALSNNETPKVVLS